MVSDALPRLTRVGSPPKAGIVHFGPGAFFRAFVATFTDAAMAAAGGDWGIIGVSLKSDTARDQLMPQGGVFTSVSLAPQGDEVSVIGSIVDVMVAPENPGAVVSRMADPKTKIVSLTITEKGYGLNSATGGLDRASADIAHDLAAPDDPKSAVGFIVAALRARRRLGVPPFTVLSCDNLPKNGKTTRRLVLEFAQEVSAGLANWIADTVSFPSTMVDRITPATTDEARARLAASVEHEDEAAVFHEPFRQWVIEDRFSLGRPAWDAVGAQSVDDVAAHEAMKLRCLNGTHSALAYLGYLAGYETIADCVADPHFAGLCTKLWDDEILPTLAPPDGEDLQNYVKALMERYTNPRVQHRTWQIAMDGSRKLPQRVLGTIADTLARGQVPVGLCLVVAAWVRYVGGIDESGRPIDVRDPMAAHLRELITAAGSHEEAVMGVLAVPDVVSPSLAREGAFTDAVTSAYLRLVENGSSETVRRYVENS